MGTRAPYGSWSSSITADLAAAAGVVLSEIRPVGDRTFWLESRPDEGRSALVYFDPATGVTEVGPGDRDIGSRVHEYGGGSYLVHGSTLFFVDYADQQIYRQALPSGEPRAITRSGSDEIRHGDLRMVPTLQHVVCVRERHGEGGVTNELVAVPVDSADPPTVLASGRDFYAWPRPSPDGRRLAYTSWDEPLMPWDGSELWLAELGRDLRLRDLRQVAGGAAESIVQPEWSPGESLHFVSDRSGWWNLYRAADGHVEALAPMEAEFAWIQWWFDLSTYAFLPRGRIGCVFSRDGAEWLGILEPGARAMEPLELPYTSFLDARSDGRSLRFAAAGPHRSQAVLALDPDSRRLETLRPPVHEVEPASISTPRAVTFPTDDGAHGHGIFYPPANEAFEGPPDELPPLLVLAHGGPAGQTLPELKLDVQFWTSRGFAVVDVNYGGSSGYGRAYRERLRGGWGIVDAADCVAAARQLAAQGEVDPRRMVIHGSSAGGFTALCAVAFHSVFAAAASLWGITDLLALAAQTHKFERGSLEWLVGPQTDVERYLRRSPINFVDAIECPVIFFHGSEDRVVPPAQSADMARRLRERGVACAWVPLPGEGHGLRRRESRARVFEAELSFYSRVLGFPLAERVPEVEITGLEATARP